MSGWRTWRVMPLSRRAFVKGAALAGTAAIGAAVATKVKAANESFATVDPHAAHGHGLNDVVGPIRTDDFDPYKYLTDFNYGDRITDRADGSKLREYFITAIDKEIEVAPGVSFPAWTLNGSVPGPTIRATEGDRVRVHFQNSGSHPHSLHFHGIHAANMDGVPGTGPGGSLMPGEKFTYEFDANPYGVHLYHCHALPVKRHIHKGLYGAYIVDPKDGWGEAANELVFMMNGFDTDLDGGNDVYALNTKAFAYARKPIRIKMGEKQRIFLINITEFDLLNSFHLHANFFTYLENGHKANQSRFTDNVALIQGERGLVEFTYEERGKFMFHAHQSEFTELGWMGLFEVV